MKSEKRMVGDYTVLCAVNIGFREIILAENEQDKNGERFLCCYGERNDIFQRYSECAVGDDYIDAALFFAERIKRDAEQFRSEIEKLSSRRQKEKSQRMLLCRSSIRRILKPKQTIRVAFCCIRWVISLKPMLMMQRSSGLLLT